MYKHLVEIGIRFSFVGDYFTYGQPFATILLYRLVGS
jgi:hypothetical protein